MREPPFNHTAASVHRVVCIAVLCLVSLKPAGMKTAPFVFWFLPAEWIIGSSALGALLFSILDARGAAVVSLPKGIGAEVVQPPPPITVTF